MILQEITHYFPHKCLLPIHTSLSVCENSYFLLEKYLSTPKVWCEPHEPQGDLAKKIYSPHTFLKLPDREKKERFEDIAASQHAVFIGEHGCYKIRSAEETVKHHYFGPEKYLGIMLITKSRSLLFQSPPFWNAVTSADKLSKGNAHFQRKYILESSTVPRPPNGWRRILKCYLASE